MPLITKEIFLGCEESIKLIKAVCDEYGPITDIFAYKTGAPELDLAIFEGPNVPDDLRQFYAEHAPKEMQELDMGDCSLGNAKFFPTMCKPERSVLSYLKE